MLPARTRPVVAVLSAAALVLMGTSASAAEDATDAVTDVITAAADAAGQETTVVDTARSGTELVAQTEEGTVTVDATAGGQVTVDGGGNVEPISIGLPEEVVTGAAQTADDGSIIFEGVDPSTDVVVQVLDDGTRIATVIGDAGAPTRYTYALDPGTVAHLEEDGSVSLTQEATLTLPDTGETVTGPAMVGSIAAPWAVDAEGRPVPTHYEVNGSTVIQVVDHTTAGVTYPVVADPQFSRSWANSYIWFNRAETKTIAGGGWGAATITGLCTAAGGPGAGAACLLVTGSLVYTAGVAENSSPKRCVAVRFTDAIVVRYAWVFTYTSSRCR